MQTSVHVNLERKYYMEIYKTLIDNNDQNNGPLSNDNIREAIHEVIEEE